MTYDQREKGEKDKKTAGNKLKKKSDVWIVQYLSRSNSREGKAED